MRASILIVSHHELLLLTRAQLLKEWLVDTANPAKASAAIGAKAYDLLILCQTIPDDIASALAYEMATHYPSSQVLVLNQPGQDRRIGSVQCTIKPSDPRCLPDAVSRLLKASR